MKKILIAIIVIKILILASCAKKQVIGTDSEQDNDLFNIDIKFEWTEKSDSIKKYMVNPELFLVWCDRDNAYDLKTGISEKLTLDSGKLILREFKDIKAKTFITDNLFVSNNPENVDTIGFLSVAMIGIANDKNNDGIIKEADDIDTAHNTMAVSEDYFIIYISNNKVLEMINLHNSELISDGCENTQWLNLSVGFNLVKSTRDTNPNKCTFDGFKRIDENKEQVIIRLYDDPNNANLPNWT